MLDMEENVCLQPLCRIVAARHPLGKMMANEIPCREAGTAWKVATGYTLQRACTDDGRQREIMQFLCQRTEAP